MKHVLNSWLEDSFFSLVSGDVRGIYCATLWAHAVVCLPPRESCVLIQEQHRKLSQLKQKLEAGSNELLLLRDHLKAVLTQYEADTAQSRDLRQQLAEGYRLAESLAAKLSPGEWVASPEDTELLEGHGPEDPAHSDFLDKVV